MSCFMRHPVFDSADRRRHLKEGLFYVYCNPESAVKCTILPAEVQLNIFKDQSFAVNTK